MGFKYGDIISLKDGVAPQMSLDKNLFLIRIRLLKYDKE